MLMFGITRKDNRVGSVGRAMGAHAGFPVQMICAPISKEA